MKKLLLTLLFVVTFFCASAVSAAAVVNDTVKVGLFYGSSALYSANLDNDLGGGYAFGYFDRDREFNFLGETGETQISMTAAGSIYMNGSGAYSSDMPAGGYRFLGGWHVQFDGFRDFEEAADLAADYNGYPAWIDGEYVVRVGSYASRSEAEDARDQIGGDGVAQSSKTGVIVTVTRTANILFEFDEGGSLNLGVRPEGWRGETATWFRNHRYAGAFEYIRASGGNISVINVLNIEDYVKGVVPYEMNGSWPMEALAAQAVCARTFVQGSTKHQSLYGFDVCNTNDCQVYYGLGTGSGTAPTSVSDQAVEETAGKCLYYNGALVRDALYHSSNGGATESAVNVYGGNVGYLTGKADPYEAQTSIPSYNWTVTYTAAELTWILEQKNYTIGTVQDVYIEEYTPLGNVAKVTFEGSRGSVTVSGITCSTIFYSSTYNKSVKSMRFNINGSSAGSAAGVYVNDADTYLSSLDGVSVISGGGAIGVLNGGSASAISASGTSAISSGSAPSRGGGSNNGAFTITGSGSGHNVGLSQYGAKAMAELGYDYQDILEFYYTGVTVR